MEVEAAGSGFGLPNAIWDLLSAHTPAAPGTSARDLAANGTAPTGPSFLCTEPCGWHILDGYSLSRCFYQGVVLQIPTLISFTAVMFSLSHKRHLKSNAYTPTESAMRQRRRVQLQFTLTLVIATLLVVESIYSWSLDVATVGPFALIASLAPVTLLTLAEVYKDIKPDGTLLFYWLFFVATQSLQFFQTFPLSAPRGVEITLTVLSLIIFLLEWGQPRRERDDNRYDNPYDQADVFSKLTFTWMSPLMRKGYEQFLTANDLPELASSDRADSTNDQFEYFWSIQSKRQRPSLFIALLQSFGPKFALGGFFKMLQDSLAFTQPQLLRLLITFVAEYTAGNGEISLTRGLYIAFGMFIVSAVQTLMLHQYFERAFGVGMNVRTAITNTIFRKSLILSGEARSTRTTGDTVSLMSIDTQRLQDVCPQGNMIWSGPFQIVLCLTSLYNLLGNSMWVGVVILIILVPINSYIASTQKVLQQKLMKDKDKRTRLTSELLSSIKSIKLYAWEDAFVDRLEYVRNDQELVSLRNTGIFQTGMTFMWTLTPFIVSCSTFATYVFVAKKPLTTDIVFPALALFNMLGFPMAVFPMLISSLIEANVAVKRITSFLMGDTLQEDAVKRTPRVEKLGDVSVQMKNATYVFKKDLAENGPYALQNIDFAARKGELSCIVGRVGAGKSTMLLSMLGDIYKVSGEVSVAGSIAYVAQNPWIFNASVKENILFGKKYDEELYQETIDACALRDDFAIFPDGGDSIVGEKGISLSGGQKARISLARAVYARADVYLLDDPLSAVDEHVGQHIITHVLGKDGLLASRTIVLATNSIPVLEHADQIAMIVNGSIIEQGTLQDETPLIKALLDEFGRKNSAGQPASTSPVPSAAPSTNGQDGDEEPRPITDAMAKPRRGSTRRPSVASFSRNPPAEVNKEHLEQGKVAWSVYTAYAKVCGYGRVATFVALLCLGTALSVASNVWLKKWAESNSSSGENKDVGWFLGVYVLLGSVSALMTVVYSTLLYVIINIDAARTLHDNMLLAVVRVPMSFFETNPLGRIVNRFSSDVYRVDQQLIRVFNMLFNNCVKVFFTIAIICYSTPSFLLIALPLAYFYLYYQRFYLRTSRELKRLDSVSRSPIFAQFQETLDGIATVRAYGEIDRFIFTNRYYLDTNNKAFFPSISANRWLAVRLEFVGSIVILAASGLAVLALPSGRITAGMIGLALSYALQVTQSLNWIVRMTVEVETNIVSVERMLEYSALKPEAPAVIPENRPSTKWPEDGNIKFVDYSTRYRPELPLVLKNVSLDIKPGEKIGIVGRTGAGKSSLTLALFRLIEATAGNITIDDVVTKEIGLKDLRSNLSIIPQDSQLFEGSVRDNLDPGHVRSDHELWRSLELSHLKNHVSSMDGQLDAAVAEGGSNMSAGQRQLLSLARALLTDSKVLVLDEATAAVDVETDQVLQRVIREEFKDRTILTIAHRLNTIIDSDRVVVLNYGEVTEFDTPGELKKREGSLFRALCERGGLL